MYAASVLKKNVIVILFGLFFMQIQAGNFLCGTTRWKAAKAISKTMSNLDECGLEVAGCRHAFGLKAVNMFRGEMYVSRVYPCMTN